MVDNHDSNHDSKEGKTNAVWYCPDQLSFALSRLTDREKHWLRVVRDHPNLYWSAIEHYGFYPSALHVSESKQKYMPIRNANAKFVNGLQAETNIRYRAMSKWERSVFWVRHTIPHPGPGRKSRLGTSTTKMKPSPNPRRVLRRRVLRLRVLRRRLPFRSFTKSRERVCLRLVSLHFLDALVFFLTSHV